MTAALDGGRRRLRLVNRTDRPWVLVLLDRRDPSLPGRVLGTVLARPHGSSGELDVETAPGRSLYAALINHVFYDSVVVSAVVTTPYELPDRPELLLEAAVDGGHLHLRVVAEQIASPPDAASAPGSRHPLE